LPGVDLTIVAQRYLDHALAGRDSEAVRTVLDPLVTKAMDLNELYEGVLAPVAERVGELWHRSEISVADEHFVTQLNQRVIAVAVTLTTRRTDHDDEIVLACPPDELHDTALRMLSQLLGAVGYKAHLLGASTPIRDLVAYVERVHPTAVGLSIASPLAIPGLERAVVALRDAHPDLRIVVGGRCASRYPAIAEVLGVTVCRDVAETVAFLAGPLQSSR
jgi:methanogenic corrinoid protein MtbC1